MQRIDAIIGRHLSAVTQLRHHFHAHPELGYEEFETAARISQVLRGLPGMEVRTGVGGTGVVATLGGEKRGPAVALRADMDALPIDEETWKHYASRTPGRAHACGHDGHISCLLGAAMVLAEMEQDLLGPVKFLFQPAEEGGAGAKRLCEEGALENPAVAAVFGFHNMPHPDLVYGQIAVRPGAIMAASGKFTLTIEGKGSHAAAPHFSIDPVLVAAQVIQGLQAIVSRESDPLQPGVVSVTTVEAGSAFNVIPGRATLRGTFRSLDSALHARRGRRIEAVAQKISEAFGATATAEVDLGYPVLENEPAATGFLQDLIRTNFPEGTLRTDFAPLMGGEDFAYYRQRVPSVFWFLGTHPGGGEEIPFCHHPAYDFDDGCIPTAVRTHCVTALAFANPLWRTADPTRSRRP